ncbi:hypothetical protein CBA19CS22_31945 [Caballeronia novacaledonica]|uniref:Uncharacterized protein n=1 Tax=Caballeronia novacaledonica TaxID=1544861 RepID=A0ACB5R1V5_9BURK|nr:hypothetical protein CBA19CS22_31945 [Caballeronia novacaledonica]
MDMLDVALTTPVDMELTATDIESKPNEIDEIVVLTDADKLNNCPPFTASMLDALINPIPTLLSVLLPNEIVGALNMIVPCVCRTMFPSAPTLM